MKTRVMVNSRRLLLAIVDLGLSLNEAAKVSGLSRCAISGLIKEDRQISYKTAARLKQTFGDDVIQLKPRRATAITLSADHPTATVHDDGTCITYLPAKEK